MRTKTPKPLLRETIICDMKECEGGFLNPDVVDNRIMQYMHDYGTDNFIMEYIERYKKVIRSGRG